ncbi:endo-1,4-beta-xylanase [Aureimonas sp. SA4125]|uniref:endo-1,4-beta-xylanase n=1 Tax=Aureimonas sp. SA4125 TaxID=2826993 RepID=UPI001CC62BF4|nr:endo-1,4-beta-xylanase [Aureimonas sp. SA4125]
MGREDSRGDRGHFTGNPKQAAPGHSIGAARLTRRSLLRAAAATAAVVPFGSAHAAGKPVPFGGAIQIEYLDSDPAYAKAFLDHCDIIMPMNELKFSSLHPAREAFNFAPADRLVDLATTNGRRSRGHTHVWWNALPAWLQAITDPAEAERVLVEHIETVMDRYRGRLDSWDVVNEVIAHDPTEEGVMRDSYWMRILGPRHVPVAFAAAARADPSARLILNDYDLEFAGDRYDRRRAIVLEMVRQLQDAGIRIDGVGIQGHLYADLKIDIPALARFGEALKSLGLSLLISELDVIDWNIRGGPDEQDAAALIIVGDLLEGVFASGRPEAVITWGITDRYSWIPDVMPRRDGKPSRPLPLDAQYRPKPWFEMVRRRLA